MIVAALMVMAADVAPASALAKPPRPITGFIDQDDYPATAIKADAQGRVDALLTINEAGLVTSCTIKRSSGHKLLDDTTCQLVLERYSFDPARNDKGQPVAVQAVLPVVWVLPALE